MRQFFVTAILTLISAGCSSTHPALLLRTPPPAPTFVRPRQILAPRFTTSRQLDVTIPWQYPAGIDPNTYCWHLQVSTDLVNWTDVPACQSGLITVTNTLPQAFFRLQGVQ